jgi:hypothetical protein
METNAGMVLRRSKTYTVQADGTRLYTSSSSFYPSSSSVLPVTEQAATRTHFTFEGIVYPPQHLLPSVWSRYAYSSSDIHETFNSLNASYVWQLAVVLLSHAHEPESVDTAVRATFKSAFNFTFVSKRTLIDALWRECAPLAAARVSILCRERPDHKPLLPKLTVTHATFDGLLALVAPRRPSFCWAPVYLRFYTYQTIEAIPLEHDPVHNLLLMARVVPRVVVDTLPVSLPLCAVNLPVYVWRGAAEYVVTEECFFLFSPSLPVHVRAVTQSTVQSVH